MSVDSVAAHAVCRYSGGAHVSLITIERALTSARVVRLLVARVFVFECVRV